MLKCWPWLLVSLLFSGCSWLAPDRDKAYLEAHQVPPLKLPPDLADAQIPGAVTITTPPPEAAEEIPEPDTQPRPSDQEAPFIELRQPYGKAWPMTLKALNHLKLEVFDQNRRQGYFRFIHSRAEQQLEEDRGLWGDFLYFFTGAESLREREYTLRLYPAEGGTYLYLLDNEGNPMNDEESVKLLNRIQEKLAEFQSANQ